VYQYFILSFNIRLHVVILIVEVCMCLTSYSLYVSGMTAVMLSGITKLPEVNIHGLLSSTCHPFVTIKMTSCCANLYESMKCKSISHVRFAVSVVIIIASHQMF
jgi:hypothetical protein